MKTPLKSLMKGIEIIMRPLIEKVLAKNHILLCFNLQKRLNIKPATREPIMNPTKPNVHTRLIVSMSTSNFFARYGCIGPSGKRKLSHRILLQVDAIDMNCFFLQL